MASNQPNESNLLVALSQPHSAAAEAYRTLRLNIQFASPDRPLHTLLATSTSPDDGKSTTIANLAITLAQTGHRTILVDADLRRPSLHRLFGLQNEHGLTSLMLVNGDKNAANTVQRTSVENLAVLTSGPLPPNPSELLSSRRMAEVIEGLQGAAEYVLFDTPPVIAVSDAAVLAPQVDGCLLVINAGRTKRDLARRAKATLEKVNANIVGVVLNNAKEEGGYSYYGEGKGR